MYGVLTSIRSSSTTRILLYLAGATLFFSACSTATIVHYQHEQSDEFYGGLDFDSTRLDDFRANNILLTIDVNQSTHTSYVVWLGLYSNEPGQSIRIEHAVISGVEWEVNKDFDQTFDLNSQQEKNGLFSFENGLKLFDIKADDLDAASSSADQFILTVKFDAGRGSESITYVVEKKIQKQMILPT